MKKLPSKTYLKHPKITDPIIYDERYRDQGWVPFSPGWTMPSMGRPSTHKLDLHSYKSLKFVTEHYNQLSARENIYYLIPFSEFTITSRAY